MTQPDTARHRLSAATGTRLVRPEIQALRAIAVLSVVAFHLWPSRLTGGYTGVDVFFVVSGFLIIGHLMKEAEAWGRIRLASFWARRARRLLPASLFVLLTTAAATLLLVPVVVWRQWFSEILASAVYGLNWLLASNAVDYLAADNSPSPVQHYWSLSVEEQFYIAWPLIIVGVLFACKYLDRSKLRPAIAIALVALTLASLAFSTYGVATDPAAAYFVTTGRAWEFGAGGILAIFAYRSPAGFTRVRAICSWLGIAMVLATVLLYNASTPFPGVAALVPVIGAVLVIWAGSPSVQWSPAGLMRLRPVQWLGDISYSLYLWHWPPIVILPIMLGHSLSTRVRLGIFAAALLAAWLTKRLIEDPVRTWRGLSARPNWVTIMSAIVASVLVGAVAFGGWTEANSRIARAQEQVDSALKSAKSCIGADAVSPGSICLHPYAVTGLTNPAFAANDIGKGVQVVDKCKRALEDSTVLPCPVGDTTRPRITVAMIGDSHAGHYMEAMDIYGKSHHVEFLMYLKTWCAGTGAVGVTSAISQTAAGVASCTQWGTEALSKIASNPAITAVVFSDFTAEYALPGVSAPGRTITSGDYAAAFARMVAAGKAVVALRDIPNAAGKDVPSCVAAHMTKYDPCTTPRSAAMPLVDHDPMVAAASKTAGVNTVDLSGIFCTGKTCHSVIGGLVVYFGDHHMTATFSRTIAAQAGPAIIRAITRH